MKKGLLTLLAATAFTGTAEAKDIIIDPARGHDATLTAGEEKRASISQACHLRDNIYAHTSYVRENVFPRIEEELKTITAPQVNDNGETYYMAENISYGDLWHAHIRYPLYIIEPQNDLDPIFGDDTQYHLQYHSYEYLPYLKDEWITQLRQIDSPALQDWLDARETYEENVQSYSGSMGYMPSSVRNNLNPLNDEEREGFAALWHKYLSEDSPGFNILDSKMKILDPRTPDTGSLLAYRSIASTNEVLRIIGPLNYDDYGQPTTVDFEDRADSPAVNGVIARAEAAGLDYIIHTDSEYTAPELFPPETDWALHEELSTAFIEAARATTAKNPHYMFGHAFEDDLAGDKHSVIGWSDNMVFGIRHYLPCQDPDRKEAATFQRQEFDIFRP